MSDVIVNSDSLSAKVALISNGTRPCPRQRTDLGTLTVPGPFGSVDSTCKVSCPGNCNGRGTCRGFEPVCECRNNSYGDSCEFLSCGKCAPKDGTCDPTVGVCKCVAGKRGSDCSEDETSTWMWIGVGIAVVVVIGAAAFLLVRVLKARKTKASSQQLTMSDSDLFAEDISNDDFDAL
jgi:hypothetical protein